MKENSSRIQFVLGGISSGKSEFAEEMIEKLHKGSRADFYYFTPAPAPEDDEMRDKIAAHRARRPEWLMTVECGMHPAESLEGMKPGDTILLDSVGTLLSRYMAEDVVNAESLSEYQLRNLIERSEASGLNLVLVSEEVGLAPVALTAAGRAFQKGMGRLNRIAAELSDDVYFIIAGIPQKIK